MRILEEDDIEYLKGIFPRNGDVLVRAELGESRGSNEIKNLLLDLSDLFGVRVEITKAKGEEKISVNDRLFWRGLPTWRDGTGDGEFPQEVTAMVALIAEAKAIQMRESDISTEVYVTLSCPFCPVAVYETGKVMLEEGGRMTCIVIDNLERQPEGITAVPTIVARVGDREKTYVGYGYGRIRDILSELRG